MTGLRGFFAVLAISTGAFFMILLAGCSRQAKQNYQDEFEAEAIRLNAPLTCFNDFLGIKYIIPKGWWLYDLNTANFSPDRADTADTAMLDIFYGDSFRRMDMARFANKKNRAGRNYFGVSIYAEARDDSAGLDEYMPRLESYMQNPADGDCMLIDSGQETFDGKIFEKRIFEMSRVERPFRIMTLTIAVRGGYFLNVIVDYWAQNNNLNLPPMPFEL